MLILTPDQRRDLMARAHPLNPTVIVGSAGLTEAVLEEIARSLNSHELIKIRVMSDDRAGRAAMLEQICKRLDATAVQHIGKILVVFRPSPDAPTKNPARRKGKTLSKKQLGSR